MVEERTETSQVETKERESFYRHSRAGKVQTFEFEEEEGTNA